MNTGHNQEATGALWKTRKLRKPSRCTGKEKGYKCIKNPLFKYMAKQSRSYKHRDYQAYCVVFHGAAGSGRGSVKAKA